MEMVRTGEGVEHLCPECDDDASTSGAVEPAGAEASAGRSGDPPEGAGRFFPFEDTRPGQARFLFDVRETLRNQDVLVPQGLAHVE
jgi:hypothetical protein